MLGDEMPSLDDHKQDLRLLNRAGRLEMLLAIQQGHDTRLGLQAALKYPDGLVLNLIADLTMGSLIRSEIDVEGISRFRVNNERVAELAAFVSSLGFRPMETRAVTCELVRDVVPREFKMLGDK
jgi:hypothetical protein